MQMHFDDDAFTADGVYFSFKREGDTFRCFADGVPCTVTMNGDIFVTETNTFLGRWKNAVDAILFGLGVSDFSKQVQRELDKMSPLARAAVKHTVIEAAKKA